MSTTNTCNVLVLLSNIFGVLFTASIYISVIMMLIAAFEYITAGDDAEKVTKARRMIFYAAIGFVVALSAWGFPSLVASIFGQTSPIGCSSHRFSGPILNP